MTEQHIKKSGENVSSSSKEEFRHLVRIANTDIPGEKPLYPGLTNIKGVGFIFANAVLSRLSIDKNKKIGDLSDNEITEIEDVLKDPLKANIPSWMLNRRNDLETGEDFHLLTSDLDFTKDNDIKRMKKMKSYKGVRHILNLPVRGQRTKSNFRKNKGKVTGVKRGKAKSGRV